MPGPFTAVAVLVGLPPPVRPMVESLVPRHVRVRPIDLKRDGGFRLELPPRQAAELLVTYADEAPSYDAVLVIVLPYAKAPPEVLEAVETLQQLGAKALLPQSGGATWPARGPALDNKFQRDLTAALVGAITSTFREEDLPDAHQEICKELLRGLASHAKMGPNNHSHEDDLWKSRGHDLGPGEREVIVAYLRREGLIARKKNRSAGGTGWVYWIADVQRVRTLYPELGPYFR